MKEALCFLTANSPGSSELEIVLYGMSILRAIC